MIQISISPLIKQKLPDLVLGVIETEVKLEAKNTSLLDDLEIVSQNLQKELSEVSNHPAISASRKAYRHCGKDPARYRLSSEALMRRVIRGLGLPQVNNVVDLVNLISLKTGMSIGGYDAEKITGKVLMDLGVDTDEYEAIGRGQFNVGNLPVLRDEVSAFGSPTSDSERTSVTMNTNRFLMVIFGFSGKKDTQHTLELSVDLLKRYAGAMNLERKLIFNQ